MTEEKKILRLKDIGSVDENPPSFPQTKKGGYLEEVVDTYFAQVFEQFSKTTLYQQETYDAYIEEKQAKEAALVVNTELEARIAELEERLNGQVQNDLLEAAEGSDDAGSSEEELRAQIEAEYRASVEEREAILTGRIEELQVKLNTAQADLAEAQQVTTPEVVSEAVTATGIIASAERLAREHVAEAQHRADNIVEDAESRISHLLEEIRSLEVSRQAAVRTLTDFHEEQLRNLPSYTISEEVAPEVTAIDESEDTSDSNDN